MLWTFAVVLIILWAIWHVEQLYDGRAHSPPADSCYYRGGRVHSMAQSRVGLRWVINQTDDKRRTK